MVDNFFKMVFTKKSANPEPEPVEERKLWNPLTWIQPVERKVKPAYNPDADLTPVSERIETGLRTSL
jgi:hypothetical protein